LVALPLRIVDEFDGGLGWITEEQVPRTSHALRTDNGVWLVDPVEPSNTVLQAPFEAVRVAGRRWWREVALWWPERGVLVCADALGTLPYFCAAGEPIGVHPLLRLTPPRRLGGLEPQRILVGHGEGVHSGASAALVAALRTSRRRAAAVWIGTLRPSRRKPAH
jgi:hypothetical protein